MNDGHQSLEPIAWIRTPFRDKFTVPRQSGLVNQAKGIIQFCPDFADADRLQDFRAHSHYWLIWGLHLHQHTDKSLAVRPPRLGGNQKTNVFTTRSPFRPNNLGLSAVKLDTIDSAHQQIHVMGVDMVDNTPIYDIKPYLPYADSINSATSTWANSAPVRCFDVRYRETARQQLTQYEQQHAVPVMPLVSELLAHDARPAYHGKTAGKTAGRSADKATPASPRIYYSQIYTLAIAWQVEGDTLTVLSATELSAAELSAAKLAATELATNQSEIKKPINPS